MSDDLLFFSLETSPDVSAKNEVAGSVDSGSKQQATDFNKVLERQMAVSNKNQEDTKASKEDRTTNLDEKHQDIEADNLPVVNGPSLRQIDENLGKTLPSLTVHDRALEVGRVILTTAKPVVDENSLSEFVRKQIQSNKALPDDNFSAQRALEVKPEYQSVAPLQRKTDKSYGNEKGQYVEPFIEASRTSEFQLAQRLVSAEMKQQNQGLERPNAGNKRFGTTANKLKMENEANAFRLMNRDVQSPVEPSKAVWVDGKQIDKGWTLENDRALLNKELARVKEETHSKSELGKQDITDLKYNGTKNPQGLNVFKKESDVIKDDSVSPKTPVVDKKSQAINPLRDMHMVEAAKFGSEPSALESVDFELPVLSSSSSLETKGFGASAIVEPAQDIDIRARVVSRETVNNLGEILTSKAEARDGFLRTQQYANWSQRFGEILGQRLSVAINNGSWNVKLNLHPSSLGHIDVTLDIGDKGIEGQINSADPVARQLLQDSLPKLRSTLAELYDQGEAINLSLGDKEKSGSGSENPDNSLEVAIDLLAEEFAVEDGQALTVNGLDLFV